MGSEAADSLKLDYDRIMLGLAMSRLRLAAPVVNGTQKFEV